MAYLISYTMIRIYFATDTHYVVWNLMFISVSASTLVEIFYFFNIVYCALDVLWWVAVSYLRIHTSPFIHQTFNDDRNIPIRIKLFKLWRNVVEKKKWNALSPTFIGRNILDHIFDIFWIINWHFTSIKFPEIFKSIHGNWFQWNPLVWKKYAIK